MSTTSGYNNERAAKGQAINLAVQDAISLGKQDDTKYIVTRYIHYYELAQDLQQVSILELKLSTEG